VESTEEDLLLKLYISILNMNCKRLEAFFYISLDSRNVVF